jgi:lipid II isoglutaminyl synthase (glutamine-hydrolysing)
MDDSVVDIALVFPELLGTYGDRGNALVLARRLERRGIEARVLEIGIDDPIPRSAAIYLLGGGEDAPQFSALDRLRASGALTAAANAGAVVLAVCAGYQLVGATLAGPDGTSIDGLGLVDAATTRAPARLVGEVAVHDDVLGTGWLVGFENHRGVTTPGPNATPLGLRKPARGFTTDGAVQGRVVGTYLHGPVLARNPRLADRLLEWAVGPLAAFDDPQAELLHEERRAAIIGARGRSLAGGERTWLRRRPWRRP